MGDPCRGSGARDGGGEVQLKKWSCNACTYENWPRAVRCAMCQVTKDFNPKGSRNIYELAFVNQDLNPHNKWSCHACTYLNWPKAVRCTQCQRNRSSSPPSPQNIVQQKQQQQSNTSEQVHDPRPNSATGPLMARAEAAARSENTTYPLMIPSWARTGGGGNDGYGSDHHSTNLASRDHHRSNDGRGGAIEKKRYSKGKAPRSTPSPPPAPSVMIPCAQSSPPNADGLDSYFNRININGSSTNSTSTTTTCTKSTLKWSCTMCTFENWPKASKCSMCCTPRGNH